MVINIRIEKRHVYIFVVLVVLLIGVFVVKAYTTAIPNPGHGGDSVLISVNGQEKNLQTAISNNEIGNVVLKKGISNADFASAPYSVNLDNVCSNLGSSKQDVWAVYWLEAGCDSYCTSILGYSDGTTLTFTCSVPNNRISCLCVK